MSQSTASLGGVFELSRNLYLAVIGRRHQEHGPTKCLFRVPLGDGRVSFRDSEAIA
jgi:hypothetical protein